MKIHFTVPFVWDMDHGISGGKKGQEEHLRDLHIWTQSSSESLNNVTRG